MALDSMNHTENQEFFQSIGEELTSLKWEIEDKYLDKDTEKEYGKTKTEERIPVNPEVLKEEMRKDLKTISLMSSEEIEAELVSYGVEISEEWKSNIKKLRILLNNARNTIANEDKNSDIVDFHIGTYTQGINMCCSVLAQLDTMSDNEIKDMIQIKEDSDNKLSYYVTFPQDKWNDKATVKITEEELNSWILTINEDWQERTLDNLPKGDKDVTLIIMAFIKRFWADFVDIWDRQYRTQNKFRKPTESKLKDNQHFEDIQDYKNLPLHSTIWILSPDEIRKKGIDFRPQTDEEVSWIEDKQIQREAKTWANITTLSNGKKACITQSSVCISDWTVIPVGHGMSLRWYDEKSEELIISGSEFNNMSEVRIPKELFIFLETASLEWTPGVDKTPQPIWILNPNEIRRKGFDFRPQTDEEVSWIENEDVKMEASNKWAIITTLFNGKKVCIIKGSMYISDWTIIPWAHGMYFGWYDEKSGELIVSGGESEVRIPKELFVFFETNSLGWISGADKIHQSNE